MDERIEASVREWPPRTCQPGYRGLRELADAEFTGTVRAMGARLFMLNGRIVGLSGGTIEDFADVDLDAHESPHPSLPLLFAMYTSGGEVEAEYYTGDTSIAEVDQTLSSGSFTGYVELSENVLSGDYYLVYYGGKSMSVAFVGAAERLVTGDEALEKADDEVGIYSVVSVDVELVDLPEAPDEDVDGAVTAHDTTDESAEDATVSDTPSTDVDIEDGATDTADGEREQVEADPASVDADSASADSERPGVTADDGHADPDEVAGESDTASIPDTETHVDEPADGGMKQDGAGSTAETDDDRGNDTGSSGSDTSSGDSLEAEKRWQETYTIPALDPKRASTPTRSRRTDSGAVSRAETDGSPSRATAGGATAGSDAGDSTTDPEVAPAGAAGANASTAVNEPRSTSDGQRDVADQKHELEALQEQLAKAQAERDDAERARDRLQQTVRELRTTVERLEASSTGVSGEGASQSTSGRPLAPSEALSGTNLFVRYSSKGKPTLADARSGTLDREAVDLNLRLERHTNFDAADVSVDGEPYETFLGGTIEYQFVEWIVRDLLYEIQETGHESGLRELFEAIMDVDRAEFGGSVSVRYVEDGDEHREQCTFDVVLRNAMGHPLIVANVNDSRDPATGDMLADLVTTAGLVAGTSDTFGCAVFVTASFFEPEALETAAEATSSGFFGGGSRESFVRVSRKQGYHLCLVEAREGAFYVNVPEL